MTNGRRIRISRSQQEEGARSQSIEAKENEWEKLPGVVSIGRTVTTDNRSAIQNLNVVVCFDYLNICTAADTLPHVVSLVFGLPKSIRSSVVVNGSFPSTP
nr:hypothetical protein CFP56_13368 [Quercus suber]